MTALANMSRRDHRVDFLRGLALASIFINHVPGNLYESLTHKNFGFSDAAEVFVVLAGFASAYAYFARYQKGDTGEASLKALRRAGALYMGHIATTLAGIALFCAAAIYFARPGYIDDTIIYMNTKPLMDDPVRGIIGLVTLGHQLGYFNILPMYMAILASLPLIMWLGRRSLNLLLAVSLIVWALAGWFAIDFPNYPGQAPRDFLDLVTDPGKDGWFFNPFAWQALFVIGFILGEWQRRGDTLRFNPWIFAAAAAYLVLAYFYYPLDWFFHKSGIGNDLPLRLWGFDKGYVGVPRFLHVLALGYVVMMSPLGRLMHRIPASNFLTSMGRHSLPVFCWGTLLSMAGAVARYEIGGSFIVDTIIIASGLAIQGLLARFLDARRPAPPAPRPEPQTYPASGRVADVI